MTAPLLQRRFATAAAAAALAAVLAAPAFAQPAPPAQPGAPAATAGAERPHRMPSPEQREARRAQRTEALRQKLQITPAQQPAWDAFTAAMRPQGPRPDMAGMAQLTTPERIDRMKALRAQHNAAADRRDEAVKTFYAALTPAQQKVFDQESRHMHGRDGMHGKDGKPGGHGGRHGQGQPVPAPVAPPPAPQ
ncbi:Spy/CpxP family protein refolding chaperone [Acidovorax sp. PRC11]|uniref:Spy/CpxP family protein refolding chaperone n=1 Tax=Acidovorax sp. PRC11 TaxID=2962592 RepID=UPI0028818165|nr:Spy/CpxP family protein refolding chaperone [Acidovorax sp. PRC11]MDT0136602.1 Spy/CpxP family protein refolding chaperone [Acidovorax sp. PRC11]